MFFLNNFNVNVNFFNGILATTTSAECLRIIQNSKIKQEFLSFMLKKLQTSFTEFAHDLIQLEVEYIYIHYLLISQGNLPKTEILSSPHFKILFI